MKTRIILFLFILIPAISIYAQSDILARKVKIGIKDGTVGDILREIGNKGGFTFCYNQEIPKYQYVSLNHSKQTVQQFLEEIFKKEMYCIEYGNKLIVMQRPEMDIVYTISGRIVDAETKQPLAGTTVYIPGSEPLIGSVSARDGYFKIVVPADKNTVKLSSIGYESTFIQPDQPDEVEIELKPDNHILEEVKIVHYLKPKEEEVNSAISIIPAERLKNIQHGTIENALQGNTSGVHVVRNSGMPGASLQVKVRGMNSLINSDPVYYLDGIPVQKTILYAISPHDISSIEVIKDGSGLSKYGIRAANGVVLLNSKMNDSKNTSVSFDYSFGQQSVWKKLDLMSKSEFLEFYNSVRPYSYVIQRYDSLLDNRDWQNIVFHEAKTSDSYFTVSGGSKRSNYYASTGYFKQEAVISKLQLERYSFKLRSEHDVNPGFYLGQGLDLAYLQFKGLKEGCFLNDFNNPVLSAIISTPVAPINDTVPAPSSLISTNPRNDNYDDVELTNNRRQNYSLLLNLNTRIKLMPGLSYSGKIGLGVYYQDNVSYNKSELDSAYNDLYYTIVENVYNIVDLTYNLFNTFNYSKNFNRDHSLNISMDFQIGQNKNEWIPVEQNEYDKLLNQLNEPLTLTSQQEIKKQTTTDYMNYSFSGSINYILRNRYHIQTNLRRDIVGFYVDRKIKKYKEVYPSLSLGWIFTKEDFFSPGFINYGKLRYGWGKAGNSPALNYSFFAKIMRDMEYTYAFENDKYTTRSSLIRQTNEQFYIENTNSYNFGLDLGFFKNRIFITLDYFSSYLSLGNKYPFDNPKVHFQVLNHMASYGINHLELSQIENRGIDLDISYKHSKQDYTGNLDFNFSIVRNKLIDVKEEGINPLEREDIHPITVNIPGEPAFSFFGYKIERLFRTEDCDEEGNVIYQPFIEDVTTGDILYAQPEAKAGDYKFADLNNDNIIDEKDRTIIGNPLPDFTFGLFYNAQYKKFDFSVLFQGSYGNEIFNAAKLWLYNPYALTNWSRDILNSYKEPEYDDEKNLIDLGNTETSLHRYDWLNKNNNLRVSDFYVEDGSYLRLKNIQLGYTFKPDLTRKIHIQKFRIFLCAQNLFTITNYTGMDPEVGGWGIDSGIYPQPRTFMGGVNLKF
jgi:TonB-linked SusC/RagA family outer membrane protein